MKQFKELLQRVLDEGEWRGNRTQFRSLAIFSHDMRFDLREGFPMVTEKFVSFKSVIAELVGFLRGYHNAADFRVLGTKIWDDNANKTKAWLDSPHRRGEDDLGRIYGVQWRRWHAAPCVLPRQLAGAQDKGVLGPHTGGMYHYDGGLLADPARAPDPEKVSVLREVDQLLNLIHSLKEDPTGRRHLVSAWNPGELDQQALPPCHVLFQCYVSNDGHLDLKMYQRSADVFLGIPFNIASYAALLHVLAVATGLQPRFLYMSLGDTHLYENQIEGARLCLQREEFDLPQLVYTGTAQTHIDDILVCNFGLHGYASHEKINVEMAV